jgi:hypothetical protein
VSREKTRERRSKPDKWVFGLLLDIPDVPFPCLPFQPQCWAHPHPRYELGRHAILEGLGVGPPV